MRTTSIKRIMYGFNVIFVITGIIMVVVGASVKSHYYPYYTFLDDRYFSLPNMLIATGSLIFFISLLGCYGTMKESWFILMVVSLLFLWFSVLLTLIFVFELSVSIAGYVLNDKTSAYVESTLYTKMTDYEKSADISSMWDLIQEEFQCCGVKDYTDWNPIFNNYSLPLSCCNVPSGVVGAFYCNAFVQKIMASDEPTTVTTLEPTPTTLEPTTVAPGNTTYPPSTTKPYESGCHTLFSDFLERHATNIGAVGISLAIIQLGGIFLSFHLARQLRNSYYST